MNVVYYKSVPKQFVHLSFAVVITSTLLIEILYCYKLAMIQKSKMLSAWWSSPTFCQFLGRAPCVRNKAPLCEKRKSLKIEEDSSNNKFLLHGDI
jgi:hypothetical protein